MRALPGVVLAVLLSGRIAAAQELRPSFYSIQPSPRAAAKAESVGNQPSVARPIAGGLAGGTVGFFAGAFIAGSIVEGGIFGEEGCDVEDLSCLLTGILAGAAIGESILLPVGVHLGNGRRGNFPLGLAASIGMAGLGVAATAATGEPAFLVPAAVAQMVVGVLLERHTRGP